MKPGARKAKLQVKPTADELPSESQTNEGLDGGNKIRGSVGDGGITLEPSANSIRVKGPPTGDWSHNVRC